MYFLLRERFVVWVFCQKDVLFIDVLLHRSLVGYIMSLDFLSCGHFVEYLMSMDILFTDILYENVLFLDFLLHGPFVVWIC